jgi:hypothetical protein
MDLSYIALQGVQQAETQLEAAATRIATFGAAPSDSAALDTIDLSAEMVALLSAKQLASVNLQILRTESAINKNLIDVMA